MNELGKKLPTKRVHYVLEQMTGYDIFLYKDDILRKDNLVDSHDKCKQLLGMMYDQFN
jgi:hypothetical protein